MNDVAPKLVTIMVVLISCMFAGLLSASWSYAMAVVTTDFKRI